MNVAGSPTPDRLADCVVCRSNSGVERMSPGMPVHEGRFWVVEHAYPTGLSGWLVIVLRRHAEALHDITREEAEELGPLQWAAATALAAETGCLKEYSVLFAEQAGFGHLHFHVVPRAADLATDLRGGGVFAFLRSPDEDVVAPEQVAAFCARMARRVAALLDR